MSDANIALIETTYAAFNRGDIQTVLGNAAANVEWVNHGPTGVVPYFGNFTGRIMDFFRAIGDSTSEGTVVIDRYIGSGDMVVTEGRFMATVRSTGAKIDSPIVHVFTVRNGKVTSWRGYGDTAAAVEAHTVKAASA